MGESRRNFFRNLAGVGAGLMTRAEQLGAQQNPHMPTHRQSPKPHNKKVVTGPPLPMESPNIPDLPFTFDGATKVFHLIAEPVKRRIVPWKTLDVWGYNGSCPGPTIQVNQGDRVRIAVENRLPEITTMHWHGLEIPIAQDGVPYISQKPIALASPHPGPPISGNPHAPWTNPYDSGTLMPSAETLIAITARG